MTSLNEILGAIASGQQDESLALIQTTLTNRRKLVESVESADTFNKVEIGDEVMLGNGISPKYLDGALAKVVDKRDGKIVVQLLSSRGRWPAGSDITCPPSIVVKR